MADQPCPFTYDGTALTENWTLPDYGFDHSNLLLREYVCIRRPTRYLYNERGSKPGKIDEIIMKILNDWGKEALPIALNGFKFRAALSCLLSEEERAKLGRRWNPINRLPRNRYGVRGQKQRRGERTPPPTPTRPTSQ